MARGLASLRFCVFTFYALRLTLYEPTSSTISSENRLSSEEKAMCDRKRCCCEKEKAPKTKPEECSAKQIKECHGDAKKHPCVDSPKGK